MKSHLGNFHGMVDLLHDSQKKI